VKNSQQTLNGGYEPAMARNQENSGKLG